ncbi:MAG: hypothetical protein ACD_59C00052G0001 [uncultured bacterium]|nr:MAG: hypothetical protein ACD_59C00052G0001 [uncultured bacterium]
MKPFNLDMDNSNKLYDIFHEDFFNYLIQIDNVEFRPFKKEISDSVKKIFESLPNEYFINLKKCYEFLDEIKWYRNEIKFSDFYSFNIIDKSTSDKHTPKKYASSFIFSHRIEEKLTQNFQPKWAYDISEFSAILDQEKKNAEKINCLTILPVITHTSSERKLVCKEQGHEVYIVLNDKLLEKDFNDKYLHYFTDWEKLNRIYIAFRNPAFNIIKKYLEFCFKEFKDFYNLKYLGDYGTKGSFGINTYLLELIIKELGNPPEFKLSPHSSMTREEYDNFLKVNGLKESIWSDTVIFNRFYKFIENDLDALKI